MVCILLSAYRGPGVIAAGDRRTYTRTGPNRAAGHENNGPENVPAQYVFPGYAIQLTNAFAKQSPASGHTGKREQPRNSAEAENSGRHSRRGSGGEADHFSGTMTEF